MGSSTGHRSFVPRRPFQGAGLLALIATCALAAGAASADRYPPASMIADLGEHVMPTFLESPLMVFVENGGLVYYVGNDGVHGTELWRSDLTTDGTAQVMDICPGARGGLMSQPPVSNGEAVFFIADDGTFGAELWRSEGTTESTRRIVDLRPGPEGSSCYQLLAIGSTVFFAADDGVHGCELWSTDGSPEGTTLLADTVAGPEGGFETDFYRRLYELDGLLLFWVGDTLWRSDGTPGGTSAVTTAPLRIDDSWYTPPSPTVFDGRLFFPGWDAAEGRELWATDGTSLGTGRVAVMEPGKDGSYPTGFTVWDGELWFATSHGDETRLWHSDGTHVGTAQVPGTEPAFPGTLGHSPAGVFYATAVPRPSLRVTDGSTSSLVQPLDDLSFSFWFARVQLDDGLLIGLPAGGLGPEPWLSQGTPETTTALGDLLPGPSGSQESIYGVGALVLTTGEIVFPALSPASGFSTEEVAGDGLTNDFDLTPWVTMGTPASTRQVRELNQQTSTGLVHSSGTYFYLGPAGDRTLVLAPDDDRKLVPWSSLGTPTTTDPLPFFDPSTERIQTWDPGPFARAGDRVLLGLRADSTGAVWSTDGTLEGTSDLTAAFPGTDLTYHRAFSAGEVALINTEDGVFLTDGTVAGTELLSAPERVSETAATTGRSYLAANDTASGSELWLLEEGKAPVPVVDLVPGTGSSEPSWLTAEPTVGSRLFFFADTGNGLEPWISDGSAPGTQPLGDVRTGPEGSRDPRPSTTAIPRDPRSLFLDGTLLFVADDGIHGPELWVSDGTPNSATLLTDLYPGPPGSHPAWLTRLGDEAFFGATTPDAGRELWRTDGTAAGTQRVADLHPGPESGFPQFLVAHGDTLFFSATEGEYGIELWRHTPPAAPVRHQDIHPGPGSSSPVRTFVHGERLWFAATDGVHGFEFWSLVLDTLFYDGFESGTTTGWSQTHP